MTKNLYRVVDTKTKKFIQEGFTKKEDAKVVRNKHNTEHKSTTDNGAKPRFVIARGTDHPHGSSDGINHKTSKKRLY